MNYRWPTLATRASWIGVFAGSELLFWPGVPSSAWVPVPVAGGLSSWFCRPGFWKSVWTEWFRMDATHSSTCKCKKLFQVYLKNKSCNQRVRERGSEEKRKKKRWKTRSSTHSQLSVESAIFSVGVCKWFTNSRSMVLSLQISWQMLRSQVCNREATSLATWRRALPRGCSRTPTVVSIALLCFTASGGRVTHC